MKLEELKKLQAENEKYKTALQDIKKHMEFCVSMPKLSTVWNIAERALKDET